MRCIKNVLLFLSGIVLALFSESSFSSEAEQLPSGVRALIYRYMNFDVDADWNGKGVENKLGLQKKLTLNQLIEAAPQAQDLKNELKSLDPKLTEEADLGTLSLAAKARAQAHVLAGAWGLNDQLMVGAFIPRVQAESQISGSFASQDSLENLKKSLTRLIKSKSTSSSQKIKAQVLRDIVQTLPKIKAENLQNHIQNELGYKPLGDWQANTFGDLNVFAQYQLVDFYPYRHALRGALIFPTGYIDDPDNLMDYDIGHGSYGLQLSSLHDVQVWPRWLELSVVTQGEYYFTSQKTTRLIPSVDFPLSKEKEKTTYQKGPEVDISFVGTTQLREDLEMSLGSQWQYIFQNSFDGQRDYNYHILEKNSEGYEVSAFARWGYSTIRAYQQGTAAYPFKVIFHLEKTMAGRNVLSLEQAYLQVQSFF